jgi:transcriptional regulator with XRE-family HTH domain
MRRVHRNLSRDEIEALRAELTDAVPAARKSIPALLRMMRLIARKSQAEYAQLCGVAPRVLTDIEAGTGRPTVETLEKLLTPFGYRVEIVQAPPVDRDSIRKGSGERARDAVREAIVKARAKREPGNKA